MPVVSEPVDAEYALLVERILDSGTSWPQLRYDLVMAAYARTHDARLAAKAGGISRATLYRWLVKANPVPS